MDKVEKVILIMYVYISISYNETFGVAMTPFVHKGTSASVSKQTNKWWSLPLGLGGAKWWY